MVKKITSIIIIIIISIITYNSINYSSAIAKNQLAKYQGWERSRVLNLKNNEVGILIEINEKRLYLIRENEIIKIYPIATGKPGSPSPIGEWSIIHKAAWGGGFGARWLGLNVPWGRYGIHGTNKPGSIGWNASSGCIRMNNNHVIELFEYVSHGTKVVIRGGPFGPFGTGFRTLVPGDRGQDVMVVQRKLKELGYYQAEIDGIYGLAMENALNKWQNEQGLEITNKISPDIYSQLSIELFD